MIKGLSATPRSSFFHTASDSFTRGQRWKFAKKSCRSDTRLYFFSQSCERNINKVESVQRNAARFTCRDYRRTSSVTDILQKLQWDSLQQRRARSRVLMLYRIRNGLVAIPAAAYLEPVPICTRRFETRYVQIRCNTGTYSQTFFPSAIRLWNNLPIDICELPPGSFKTHLNSFRLS